MKICMLGAGALGSTIGATLSEGGCDVVLVDPFAAHVEAINTHGLRVRTGDGATAVERLVPVRAATSAAGLGPVDLVIVLVKGFHTRAAIEGARELVGPHTMVLSLQNGLGNDAILAQVLGEQAVLDGVTYVGGRLLGPGQVSSGVAGKHTVIGERPGGVTNRVQQLANTFTAAGLDTRVSDNIAAARWSKLLTNVSTGALSVITRLTYGDLYAVPEIEACALAAIREGMDVAAAAGVQLDVDDPRAIWSGAAEGLPADFKTSMLQSIGANSLTEIDLINGPVVTWGEQVGVPTPVNRTLVAAVKGIERGLTR